VVAVSLVSAGRADASHRFALAEIFLATMHVTERNPTIIHR